MTLAPKAGSASAGVVSALRRWFAPTTLVIGALVCALALARMLDQNTVAIHLESLGLTGSVLCAIVSLMLSAEAWRMLVAGVSGHRLAYAEAISQVGLVLVGKYVPGKISGIAARVVANNGVVPARRVLLATMLEQAGAMAAASVIGLVAFLSPVQPLLAAASAAAALAALMVAPMLLPLMLRTWPKLAGGELPPTSVRQLRVGFTMQALQWLMLASLVCFVSSMVDSHDAVTLVRIAGAYALAVTAGQILLVFPGGIGPREGVFVWLLSGMLDTSQAFAIALALRVATTGIDLLGAVGYLARRLLIGAGLRKENE